MPMYWGFAKIKYDKFFPNYDKFFPNYDKFFPNYAQFKRIS